MPTVAGFLSGREGGGICLPLGYAENSVFKKSIIKALMTQLINGKLCENSPRFHQIVSTLIILIEQIQSSGRNSILGIFVNPIMWKQLH